jgi:hypothetical protein
LLFTPKALAKSLATEGFSVRISVFDVCKFIYYQLNVDDLKKVQVRISDILKKIVLKNLNIKLSAILILIFPFPWRCNDI